MNANRFPNIMESGTVGGDLEDPSFKMKAVIVADGPFIMLTEDLVKRLSCPGNKGRSVFGRRMNKLGIEGRTVDRVRYRVASSMPVIPAKASSLGSRS